MRQLHPPAKRFTAVVGRCGAYISRFAALHNKRGARVKSGGTMHRQEALDARRWPAAAFLVLALAGCAAGHDRAEVPGADQPYPNLATVPERPKPATTREQRRGIVGELVSEREAARQTDRALRAETTKQ
jgi:hypothetical protein